MFDLFWNSISDFADGYGESIPRKIRKLHPSSNTKLAKQEYKDYYWRTYF